MKRRLGVSLLIGPLVGLVIGAIIAAVAFESWGTGSVMVMVGTAIAGTMLALLWGGYSSLESPDPGREPSDTERPIADRSELVREESEEPRDSIDERNDDRGE
ncbi:MAG TPA: hypothetical protein VFM38_14900 [Candidatus Limnocylindrales bacterium]|jgi:hypothetical protein|nr:hypothetical protein [Candidatus Limnocylindrales bacterium]